MHDFHERLPGFDAGNIWHDGCAECEERAAKPFENLHALDHQNFRQAWADMLAEKWSGGQGTGRRVSTCDYRLLGALYTFAVILERVAGLDPHELLGRIDQTTADLEEKLRAMGLRI